ncbi:hypothetical protein A3A76_00895 [Candidatus Woesebacteria bacterium RIFCSPLOWO2_01_FULL_39_23]|uniref:Uncharacterized protein n=1 Tax=Candidatus Woesebacteria bacterium RIFCSPHIGHO2_01_FULL_40_22 TaxID=1802499 RepID=A0A1F7YIT3_9BACT|nr:MAG: hypothetical protein A2141_05540 [Candidatus Woesebacteria bacterium RBG_16_40_11]OGM26799.1 MAG: hypothetical protein A2628_04570 [Candidatus Woesebacteria bacterium RIFCSPHIGHO2_01_FULL_40_22]OGM35737.1 MAG: hypothetical protein A3E41_03720 [Candidatus Woesebacteria bacterium RIFCSPHIGHO2_12_FULL_38_9]OGM63096.1 MAG: hypothetical protein A3A76_00895 [Candidatus Woesebacteria bacterium RIFCSPLOWO2_01_FULL_39_23]
MKPADPTRTNPSGPTGSVFPSSNDLTSQQQTPTQNITEPQPVEPIIKPNITVPEQPEPNQPTAPVFPQFQNTPPSMPAATYSNPFETVTPPVTPPQPTVPITNQASPMDPPPSPPSVGPSIQDTTPNLNEVITPRRSRSKLPILLILGILILLVAGGVGYLAYQNMQLKNKVTQTPLTQVATPTPDIYTNLKTFRSNIIPVEFKVPSDWEVSESQNQELGNQKIISVKSLDFAYEGSAISKGFEFRVGPMNDLTQKYDAFEEFTAEENKDGKNDLVVLNGIKWLKNGSSAKTLIDRTPVPVALYTGTSQANVGVILFNKILSSFRIVSQVTQSTPSASPSPNLTGPTTSPTATPAVSVDNL